MVEIEIHDAARYEAYKRLTPATIEPFGGRFVVRGGDPELIEGEPEPKRFVVLEFPDRERAKAWWASPAYAQPKAMRQASATTRMILVDGFAT